MALAPDAIPPARRRRRLRVAAAAAATVAFAAAAPLGSAPAYAAQDASAADVVFLLAPGNPGVLATLRQQPHTSAHARSAALRRAQPTTASRHAVLHWLDAHGFTVTGQNAWSVRASAPASLAATALGVRLQRHDGHLGHEGTLRPPTALAGAVTGVVGLDSRPVFHHAATAQPAGTLGAATLHAAYDADPDALGAGATIATIQFSGWRASDLLDYAEGTSLDATAAPQALQPQVTAIGRTDAYQPDDGDGDFEVALDQESLLATAPQAAQHLYIAQNSVSGFVDALSAVLSDVTAGQPVTALSISWGDCEQDLRDNDPAQFAVMESTLQQLVTEAGVTVFAASGDAGAHDCTAELDDGSTNPEVADTSVDFPASSPYVVGVGGTTLTPAGDGWSETAWGPSAPTASGDVTGSGGGYSVLFSRSEAPWQVGIGAQLPTRGRAVPDIASVADPQQGFAVYNARNCGSTGWCLGGGTSASAPAQAGLFVSALAAATGGDPVAGIGDIHAALYASPDAFRDVTTGGNGVYVAGPGYDPVTGLGTPQWRQLAPRLLGLAVDAPVAVQPSAASVPVYAALPHTAAAGTAQWAAAEGTADCGEASSSTAPASVPLAADGERATTIAVAAQTSIGCLTATTPVIVDGTAPTATALLEPAPHQAGKLLARWAGTDGGAVPSGVGLLTASLRDYAGHTVWSAPATTAGSAVVTVPAGRTYHLLVQAVDRAGNASAWAGSAWVKVPLDDTTLTRHGPWLHATTTHAYRSGVLVSAVRGASVSRSVNGSAVWLLATTGPTCGFVNVFVDGHFVRRLDLWSRTWRWQQPIVAWSGGAGTHRVSFVVTGTHRAASRGSAVYVDGIDVR